MKEKLKELIETLDSSESTKLDVISKLTGVLAELQKPDVEVPVDVFELFDTNDKRVTLLATFATMLMQGVSVDFQ
jgi:hypothetical protein